MSDPKSQMTETTPAIAIARVKSQMEGDSREFDDEDASFRVGDVRALIDEIERLREYEWMYKDLCQ